jgi:hypothetical protein
MIILQFDDAYYHWGLLAIQSLWLHESKTPVLCNTANLTESQIGELKNAHQGVSVTNGVSFARTHADQMAARKPFVILHAMDCYPEARWYALLDADFLIRRPLGSLWSFVDKYPAALFVTDGYENGRYYRQLITPSGIVLVRPDARRLIDCWAKWHNYERPLYSIAPGEWYWDQITLAEAWIESGIPCAKIPLETYADDVLRDNSAIWSANVGDRKQEYYERFRDEYRRQRTELIPAEASLR